MNRRDFSKMAAAGSVGVGVSPVILADPVGKAPMTVLMLRNRHSCTGSGHITEYSKLANVSVAALCDVDSNLFDERVKKFFTDKDCQTKIYTTCETVRG